MGPLNIAVHVWGLLKKVTVIFITSTIVWCHSTCQQIWKTQQWPQDWKRSVFIPIPKKGNGKECSNYFTIALNSHASIPLQYSCLENPMDRGAWQAAVHEVAESDTTEWLHFHFLLSCVGERNGSPLQYSCLENPRDRGACRLWGRTESDMTEAT